MTEKRLLSPRDEYEAIYPVYQSYARKLQALLIDILENAGVKYHIIEARAKDISSFAEKITRPGKSYKNPLKDITDLCGCRIILYYADEVEIVSKIIKNEFHLIEENLTRQPEVLEVDRFGYISAHYLISTNSARSDLIEWGPYRNLVAEVQIRTVIQHAWSAVSHAIQYKQEAGVPSKLQRRLHRIAGIFELADEEFVAIKGIRESFKMEIRESVKHGLKDIELTTASIEEFILSWDGINELRNKAISAGFMVSSADGEIYTGDIYKMSMLGGIVNLEGLSKAVASSPKTYFNNLIKLSDAGAWQSSDAFLIVLALAYYNRERISADFLENIGFQSDVAETVIAATQ